MKRMPLATLATTLALGTLATATFAQNAPDAQADFGPVPPPGVQMQRDDMTLAPGATTAQPGPTQAPPYTAREAASEDARAVEPMPLAPASSAPDAAPPDRDARAQPHSRRAAPEAPPRGSAANSNPQTGHEIGRGLFNNWGPNDFGA